MSRSGYNDDYDENLVNLYRGTVSRAIGGKRGQAFLKEMLSAMDAMADQRLIANELDESTTGSGHGVCAIGSVGKARGIDMTGVDPEDSYKVSGMFNIADCMAREIVYMNDEAWDVRRETPEQRFARMRKWIISNIRDPAYSQRDDRDLVWC